MNYIRNVFRLFAISALLFIVTYESDCHYSCLNCTTSSYTHCFACSQAGDSLLVLQDPKNIDPLYQHSIYPSGICKGMVPSGMNLLGLLVLIASIIGLLMTQSFQVFFICSTLQTFSLFGLLQVAWIYPSSFILQAFQYFMPISLITSSAKTADRSIFLYGFYRLDEFMKSTQDIGLIVVFAIDTVLFIVITLIFILTKLRRNKDQQTANNINQEFNHNNLVPQYSTKSQKQHEKLQIKQNNNEQQPQQNTITSKLKNLCSRLLTYCLDLRKIMHLFAYIFFFLIQETIFNIMVGAVFSIDLLDIAIWVVYFIQIVVVLVISFFEYDIDKKLRFNTKKPQQYGLSLFISRECMFVVFIKKALLPLGIVLPPHTQYLFVVFYLVLFLIEGTFDSRSGRIPCFSRITLWKIFQMCVTTLIISFFFNQKKGSQSSSVSAINIILTLVLALFIVSLFFQFGISLFGLVFGTKKVQNQYELKALQNKKLSKLNNTQQTLNDIGKLNQNVFQTIQIPKQDNVFGNRQRQLQQRKNKVQVIEFEDQYDENLQQNMTTKNQNHLVVKNNQRTANKHKQFHPKNQQKTQTEIKENRLQIQKSQQKKVNFFQSQNRNKAIVFDQQNKKQKLQQNDNDELKKKNTQKRRIQDPQLRKRYGIK